MYGVAFFLNGKKATPYKINMSKMNEIVVSVLLGYSAPSGSNMHYDDPIFYGKLHRPVHADTAAQIYIKTLASGDVIVITTRTVISPTNIPILRF